MSGRTLTLPLHRVTLGAHGVDQEGEISRNPTVMETISLLPSTAKTPTPIRTTSARRSIGRIGVLARTGQEARPKVGAQLIDLGKDETFGELSERTTNVFVRKYVREHYGVDLPEGAG